MVVLCFTYLGLSFTRQLSLSPVLMYGAEIWGTYYKQAVEIVHYYACERYMCVRLNSTNDAVLVECGRFPM